MSRWIAALVVVGLVSAAAAAPTKVDWSQYLEKPGDRVARKATPTPKAVQAKPARVTKAKAPPKAKARPKAAPRKRR